MDCCFNRYIPKSQDDMIVIRPAGKTFINGMSEAYSIEDYDENKIKPHGMTRKEYE